MLNGATILYGSASELRATLDYDFAEEKKFSYKNLSMEEIIHHLAFFVSRLWQIHVFGEGNTRTTAVFLLSILEHLDLMQLTTFLRRMHGILEMHLLGPIITI